ncbi:MAG: hypothetical protein BWK76_15960 [Desulfobulbaceae bacterium A2]|nr:MAG: hypothetical protein BWK76_15960 [Desulfobulbaceae bacterium A2]
MTNENHDNIFDKDDALDCVMFQEVGRQGQGQQHPLPPNGKGGCLGLLFVSLLVPTTLGYVLITLFR